MVCDFRDLKATWMKYDHSDLNDFFVMPTAEVLAKQIYDDIQKLVVSPSVIVRVWETDDSWAEYSE